MHTLLARLLAPPQSHSYEATQKAKLVYFMLLAAFLGMLASATVNFVRGDVRLATILVAFAAICLVGLYLNQIHHADLAAFPLCASLFVVIDVAIYNGISLHDASVMAYPVFILCTTFLFRERGLLVATILSIGCLAAFYLLEARGLLVSSYHSTPNRLIILSILVIALAMTVWVVRETWETHLQQLQESYDLTLQGWARALEYRDGETEGHCQRTTELCVALARKLGYSEDDIPNLRRGAYLHDIGKMAMPDRILLKPGPLDATERELMQQHPALALKLIAAIPFLQPALDIPYSHHELWNGSGYPQGLQGEAIPQAARIFTVVDNWDALTSDRPYRKAWPREQAMAYLRENAGRLFDPQVVEVFATLLREGEPGLHS